jgi:hypothetical protein
MYFETLFELKFSTLQGGCVLKDYFESSHSLKQNSPHPPPRKKSWTVKCIFTSMLEAIMVLQFLSETIFRSSTEIMQTFGTQHGNRESQLSFVTAKKKIIKDFKNSPNCRDFATTISLNAVIALN